MKWCTFWVLRRQSLPTFHALRGCDAVSRFTRHGKRTVWTSLPKVTQTLIDLSTIPDHTDENSIHTIERFIILLYNRTSIATDIKEALQTVHKEEQCPTDPTNKCSPEAAWSMSNIPGWACLRSGSGSCPNIAITNWLVLDQDQWHVQNPLDSTQVL